MMDWTDRHCRSFNRLLSREALLYTEMVTAPALVRGGAVHLLAHDAGEHPLALQLGGSDPVELAQAARMERHGEEDIGPREALRSGPGHPRPERGQRVGAPAMLQRQHERAALRVVDEGRSRPRIDRGPRRARAAQGSLTRRIGKGHPAGATPRRLEKDDLRPVLRREFAGPSDRRVRQGRERRPDEIGEPTRRPRHFSFERVQPISGP